MGMMDLNLKTLSIGERIFVNDFIFTGLLPSMKIDLFSKGFQPLVDS